MDNIIHHTHKKSLGGSVFTILLLIVFCFVLLLSCIKLFKKYRHAVEVKNQYAREYEKLVHKQSELQESIDRLSSPSGIEYEVRERYRVVKPGEELILVIDNKQPILPTEQAGFFNNLLNILIFWK